jgi:hypothetical protein
MLFRHVRPLSNGRYKQCVTLKKERIAAIVKGQAKYIN